MFIVYLQSNT